MDIPGDRARNKERKRLAGGGRRHFSDESSNLNNIQRNREKNLHVSCKMIKTWALNEAQSTDVQIFCASRGWLSRSLVRNKSTIRRSTTTGQKLPTQLSQKRIDFILYNKRHRESYQFGSSIIVNMDETLMWADMPSSTTITEKGSKTVPINSTGHEKYRLTVCLAARADGTKLLPLIVIPGKKIST